MQQETGIGNSGCGEGVCAPTLQPGALFRVFCEQGADGFKAVFARQMDAPVLGFTLLRPR